MPSRDPVFTIQINWLLHNRKNSHYCVPDDCAYLPGIFTAHSVFSDFDHITKLSNKFLECSESMNECLLLDNWFVPFHNTDFSNDLVDSCLQILYKEIIAES